MNKQGFMAVLRQQLQGLPESDIEKSLEYYSESIDDRMEEGMTEEEAVADMEPPAEIARQIFMDMPLTKVVKAKARPSRPLRVWEIVLVVVGSPVWVPLAVAAILIFLAVYVTIWALVVTFYAVDLSFAVSSLFCLVQTGVSLFTRGPVQVVYFVGSALFLFGAAVLLFFAFNALSVRLVQLSRNFMQWAKSHFVRKEETV